MNGMRSQIKNNKYSVLVRQYLQEHMAQYDNQLAQNVNKLIDMVRLTLSCTDEQGLMYVINRFDIDIDVYDKEYWPIVKRCVPEVLKAGTKLAKDAKEIDFTDMIWLPSSQALNLTPKQYDFVLVDEAQDLSPAQRELVLKARRNTGRFIAVGDRSQAIYGFAGASLRSIDEIIEATNAIEMPLSICYRCPKSVIAEANKIYKGTEAAPDAPEGLVENLENSKVGDMVGAGDLILCRLTAPLVSKCLELLREGKRANVRGKDLGSQFTNLITAMEKKYKQHMHIDTIVEVAHEYERWQVELLSINLEENEMKIASLQDKIDTLVALYEAYKARNNGSSTLDGFKQYIERFFAEDKEAQIILSTGHRAKGLEYKRVFILGWDKLPHPKARTAEQLIQEHNLMYVMVTRAQEALYLCMDYVPVAPEPIILSPFMAELFEDEESEELPTFPVYAESLALTATEIAPIALENALEAPVLQETVEYIAEVVEAVEPSESVVALPTREIVGSKGGYKRNRNRVSRHIKVSPEIDALLRNDVKRDVDTSELVERLLRQHYGVTPESPEPEPTKSDKEIQGLPEYPTETIDFAQFAQEVFGMPESHPIIETLRKSQQEQDAIRQTPYQYRIMPVQEVPKPLEDVKEPEEESENALILQQEERVIRQFYTCLSKFCKHHWTADYRIDKHGSLYRLDNAGKRITSYEDSHQCPKCGNSSRWIKVDSMKAQYSEVHKCDDRCRFAKGSECTCSCAGYGHGTGYMIGTPLLVSKEGNGQATTLLEV